MLILPEGTALCTWPGCHTGTTSALVHVHLCPCPDADLAVTDLQVAGRLASSVNSVLPKWTEAEGQSEQEVGRTRSPGSLRHWSAVHAQTAQRLFGRC